MRHSFSAEHLSVPTFHQLKKAQRKTKTPFLARCPECRTFKLFHVKLSDSLKTLTKSQTPANPHLRSPLRLSIIMQPRHIFIKVSLWLGASSPGAEGRLLFLHATTDWKYKHSCLWRTPRFHRLSVSPPPTTTYPPSILFKLSAC